MNFNNEIQLNITQSSLILYELITNLKKMDPNSDFIPMEGIYYFGGFNSIDEFLINIKNLIELKLITLVTVPGEDSTITSVYLLITR